MWSFNLSAGHIRKVRPLKNIMDKKRALGHRQHWDFIPGSGGVKLGKLTTELGATFNTSLSNENNNTHNLYTYNVNYESPERT